MTVEWPGFDLSQFLNYLLQIAGAYVLVLPVAWERERATRIMGPVSYTHLTLPTSDLV